MKKQNKANGFTLIELLIVIAVIAILAAVVFVALDPLKRFQDARDSQRWSDVSALISAIKTDQVDNGGAYLAEIASTTNGLAYTVGTCITGGNSNCGATTTQAACVDLSGLVSEGYLGLVPQDPSTGSVSESDNYLIKRATGIVEIGACDPEGGSAISISR
ncbi:type II secretion system GspH family protein [bacterium]|nr:type II secretion system GspH family protein [bacterium]